MLRGTGQGIGVDQLQSVMKKAEPFKYVHEGAWEAGRYDQETRISFGEAHGKITTVMSDVRPPYITNLKKLKL